MSRLVAKTGNRFSSCELFYTRPFVSPLAQSRRAFLLGAWGAEFNHSPGMY